MGTDDHARRSLERMVRPICDACAKEIRHENADDEYLKLSNPYRPGGGCVTDVAFPPLLERPMNFCDMRCLCAWAAKEISPFTGQPYWPNDGLQLPAGSGASKPE